MNILKRKSKLTKAAALVLAVFILIGAACALYLGDYYHADTDAIAAFTEGSTVETQIAENGNLLWVPEDPSAGLIFYPGGKVDHAAYAPLMSELSDRGILCVLVQMPFRLAVLDMDAAEGIQEQYPQVETWYIGGHSLGGSMAASYLEGSTDSFAGLILLGSYSTADLSETELSVLSIFGSEDQVLNREKYQQYKVNLPEDTVEIVLDGGCHAFFGMYGPQEGDGIPTITNEEQLKRTAEAVAALMEQVS